MTVTVSPAAEACMALVERINAGTAYGLEVAATYNRVKVDPLEEIEGLRVDVVHEQQTQLRESLDIEDDTSHVIYVWVRSKLQSDLPEEIDQLSLLVRQIYQQLNDWDSADGRVRVWECDEEERPDAEKEALRQMRLFVALIAMRVEVEDSY
jgi:hypothetical protein